MFDMQAVYEPTTIDEALGLLADNPTAGVLAGGTDVLVKLRDGKLGGREWVSIQRVDEMRQITLTDDGTIRVGGLCTFTEIASHPIVRQYIPSLGEAVSSVGGPQVRHVGTIGGNLCNGVPSADSASTCFAWDGSVELRSIEGVRVLKMADFYISAGRVDLAPGELLTAVLFPKESYDGYYGAFYKYAMRNAMDIATVNCSTTVKLADDGTIADARIAFGVAAPTPIRAPQGEAALRGQAVSDKVLRAAGKAAIADTRARDSWRASKAFREHMLAEMCRRVLATSIRRAGGEVQGVTK